MSDHDTTLLADLVGRKHACLVELRELGRRQFELIESGDMTELLGLLAVKQRAIGRLHELERGLDPYRAEDPNRRVWRLEAERVRCASLADQAARLLAEVLDLENRCEASLRRRRDETARQLAFVQAAGEARGAYAAAAEPPPASSLDLVSET